MQKTKTNKGYCISMFENKLHIRYCAYFMCLLLIFFGACSSMPNKTQKLIIKQETKIQPKIITKKHKGTVYSQAGSSLFADKKDLDIGDIIQVNVDELLISNSKNQKDLSKDSAGSSSFSLSGQLTASGSLQTNSQFKFKGGEKNDVSEKFKTTISAVIKERYTNGNYFIIGHSQIEVGGSTQTLEISGIIRPYDITSENSVTSSQIANLNLKYSKAGLDSSATKQPWAYAIAGFLWPF